MKLANFGELGRNTLKIAAASLLAVMIATSPMVFDLVTDSETVSTAFAGRAQTGPGEW